MQTTGVYLYGVIPRTHDGPYCSRGVQGNPVSLCSSGDLSAAFSYVLTDAELPDRRGHYDVMRRLLTHDAVLPAPEPTILDDLLGLLELLAQRQRRMVEQLQRVSGAVQFRLSVRTSGTWGDDDRNAEVSSEGQAEQAYLRARFLAALRSGGFWVRSHPLSQEHEVLRLTCLIPRASLQCFSQTCEALGARLDPAYALAVSSAMAPVDFTDPELLSRPRSVRLPFAPAHRPHSSALPMMRTARLARVS